MRRAVIGALIVAMGLVIGAPTVQGLQWDPDNPPPWIPVTAEADRPSGDDGGWVGTERVYKSQHNWWEFDQWFYVWVILPIVSDIVKPSTEPAVVTEGADEESSAPVGCN